MQKLLKRIAGPILLILLSILLAEGLLRIIPSPIRHATIHEIGSADSVLGIEMVPGAVSKERQSCVDSIVTINSLGWRDRERTIERIPGKTRIAVIGDSFVAGFQVGDDETLTRQLEEILGPDYFEVLNFGMSALGTVQEEILYDQIVREYKPDIVLVGFYSNDLQTNGGQNPGEAAYLTTRDENGNLVKHPDTSSFAGTRRWFRTHSATFRLLKLVDRRVRALRADTSSEESGTPQALPADLGLYTEPDSVQWQRNWRATEQAFKRLQEELDPATKLFVFAFPDILQVADDPRALVQSTFGVDLPEGTNFRIPHDRLFSFLTAEGFNAVDLLPRLVAYKESNALAYPYFYHTCDGHMNAQGLRLSAEILADALRSTASSPMPAN